MRLRAKFTLPAIAGLKEQLYRAELANAQLAAKRYAAIVQSLLLQTTRYWGQSENNEYAQPVPRVRIDVKGNSRTGIIRFAVNILMLDPNTGRAHFIWHILSQGRRTYTFPIDKQSPPIPIRRRRRTAKRTLQVQPFGGYTGEYFVIRGGQTVRGVGGNQWYELAAQKTLEQANRDSLLQAWPATVKIVPMQRGD